jgi:flavodoxin
MAIRIFGKMKSKVTGEVGVLEPSARELANLAAGETVAGRASSAATEKSARKILIAYFSRTGTTRQVADLIRQSVGGDIVEVKPVNPYPAEYRATTDQAKWEQETNFRPPITTQAVAMETYDTVFIGYPNWWGTMPMPLFTFLEKYDVGNKTLIPFCTHEGSRLGHSVSDIKALCPNSTVLDGLALRGGSNGAVKTDGAGRDIAAWLRKLGLVG